VCIAVVLGYRGRGVGTRLLRALLDEADRHDVHALVLNVHLRNSAALRLYMACGFRVAGAGRGWLGVALAWTAEPRHGASVPAPS
jgi:ribosomal protein S18 acetylase RimI-like enzyme